MSDAKGDHLSLQQSEAVQRLLKKQKQGVERVIFSDFIVKINKRDKEQTRVVLITDKALYNLMPSDYGKCKRRIGITDINAVTMSKISDEFVVHVPNEYDYRFKSAKKRQVADALKVAYGHAMQGNPDMKLNPDFPPDAFSQHALVVVELDQASLKDTALTKSMARLQTREEVLKRVRALMAQAHDSDDEDKKNSEEGKDQVNMLEGPETVSLGDFELLKVLGRGSFGKVMQVRMKSNGKLYAMKILKKQAIIARNQVEHTKAERKILQSLQHPFLMTLRYAFQTREKLYFVLDYYQGGELFFHLKNKRRFSEEIAKLYVAEIALALGHLHSLGIVYRDLKPENILLDDNGHCCLTDFGLSKDMSPDDQAHTFCGTPEYLAPEIVTGVGHRKEVDWWSLGILLYELTVGIPPFYSQNVNEMYNKIQHGVLRFPPFLTTECKNLIVGLLHRDPNKRLGAGDSDIDDIKRQDFFKGMDWDKLMRKEITPLYKPKVSHKADTSNFDNTFTAEPAVDSHVPVSTLAKASDAFQGFTFVPDSSADGLGASRDSDDDEPPLT